MHDIKKITIISDTHGIIDEKIVPYLKNTDMIIHAGDIMDTKIINQLNSYCDIVVLVAGNNDIPERFCNPEDKEITEDLIVAAINDAKQKGEVAAQEEMKSVTGGLPLPPGMKLPF